MLECCDDTTNLRVDVADAGEVCPLHILSKHLARTVYPNALIRVRIFNVVVASVYVLVHCRAVFEDSNSLRNRVRDIWHAFGVARVRRKWNIGCVRIQIEISVPATAKNRVQSGRQETGAAFWHADDLCNARLLLWSEVWDMRAVKPSGKEKGPLVYLGLLFFAEALDPLHCSISKLTILHVVVRDIERFEADGVSVVTPVVDCIWQEATAVVRAGDGAYVSSGVPGMRCEVCDVW